MAADRVLCVLSGAILLQAAVMLLLVTIKPTRQGKIVVGVGEKLGREGEE